MVEERDDEAAKKQNAQHRLIQVDGAIFTRLFSLACPIIRSIPSIENENLCYDRSFSSTLKIIELQGNFKLV